MVSSIAHRRPWHTAVLACLIVTSVLAEVVALHMTDPKHLRGASPSCLAAYNNGVSCEPEICSLYCHPQRFLSVDALEGLCTAECYESLVAHRDRIAAECLDDTRYYPNLDSTSYKRVTHKADQAIANYNRTCLKGRYVYDPACHRNGFLPD